MIQKRTPSELVYKILNYFHLINLRKLQDFYTEEHWNRLPLIWKSTLEKAKPEMLTDLFKLKSDKSPDQIIWPLSLLCLRSLIQELGIPRGSQHFYDVS